MKSLKTSLHKTLLGLLPFLAAAQPAFALDQIIRPYQSVRSASMGGVRMTTGLYDENFFNNPARVTANPHTRFTFLQLTPEVTEATLTKGNKIVSGGNALGGLTESSGTNLHLRTQLVLPAFYLAPLDARKWGLAIGFIGSVQSDSNLRKNYNMNLSGLADIGPAVTFGWKFLTDDALSIGATGRLTYRVGMAPDYSLLDYVRGVSLSANNLVGDGAMFNADFGATYRFTTWGDFNISAAFAAQNILGPAYSNKLLSILKRTNTPPGQPRSYGFGFSATRPEWGRYTNTSFAIEVTDVLNNSNGSLFRLLHVGAETHWKTLAFRAGLNQGYLTGGIGIDIRNFTFNIGTYGEEMSLNAGGLEDRRYTFDLGIHI